MNTLTELGARQDVARVLAEIMCIYNADVLGKNVTSPFFTTASPLPNGFGPMSVYSQQLASVLGKPPVSFALSAGALPPGMTLSPNGALTGAPIRDLLYDFTIRATDAAGMFTEQLFVLSIIWLR